MIIKGLIAFCGVLMLVAGGLWLQNGWQGAEIAALHDDIASKDRSIITLTQSAKQSRESAEVAKAEAERARMRSAEFELIRDNLRNGNDEALPCWFVDDLAAILGRVPWQCEN